MFAALGVKVTLLDQRPTLLDFVDRNHRKPVFPVAATGGCVRLGEKVVSVGFDEDRTRSLPRWKAERKSADKRCSTRLDGRQTATS